MNLLVIGGCGELGWEVVRAAQESALVATCVATYRHTEPTDAERRATPRVKWVHLDCGDHAAARDVLAASNASAVIYCAVPKHGGANSKGGDAIRSGIVDDVANLATVARPAVRFLALSTDLVYDGKLAVGKRYGEDDPVSPTSVYAQAKADLEARLAGMPNVCVARTSLILTLGGPDLPGRTAPGKGVQFVLDALEGVLPGQSGAFDMFTDEMRCMSFSDDLAAALVQLASPGCPHRGIVHLVSDEVTTRYELACRLADRFGKRDAIGKTVRAGLSAESGMNRPLNCALRSDLLRTLLKPSGVRLRGLSERSAPFAAR
jgi:dTDP-4-dehydrorhamnose reductase